MKLEIKKDILMEQLNNSIKGISNKNIIPVLNCIKFELTNEGLNLLSTDNDIAIKLFIGKENIENIDTCGELLVSGKYIYDIIKKLPNEIVKIEEVVDNKVFINTSSSSFNLNCNNASEFPRLDLKESNNPIIINKKIFKNIIKQTSFATSTQESRPILTGINFKISKNLMEVTATDSYRVSKKNIYLDNEVGEEFNLIIPTRNLNELSKLLDDEENNIEIHVFNNKVIFKFDNIIMMSRLINGTFPDISKLIPTESDFKLKLDIKLSDFYNALDRASLFTNEDDKNTIELKTGLNEIVITSNIPEIGNVEEKIEATKNNDSDIEIAFSSRYMMEALKALECENVEISFSGEVKPIIIKNKDDDNLIELIVPIRTY